MEFLVEKLSLHPALKKDVFDVHVFTFPGSTEYDVIQDTFLHDKTLIAFDAAQVRGVGIYIYSYIKNSEGVTVRTCACAAHHFFEESSMSEDTVSALPFINSITNEQVGTVDFKYIFPQKLTFQKKIDLTALKLAIKPASKHVCFDRFDSMIPLDHYIKRVHAPFFKTHLGPRLPGWAFWLGTNELNVTELFYERVVRACLWRFSLLHDDDALKKLHDSDLAAIFFTAIATFVQSYEYIADTTYSLKEKKRISCESFDCFLVRRGGDCEDSSLATVRLIRSFQKMQPQTPFLQKMHAVVLQYVAVSTLGMVTNASAANWNNNNDKQKMAHMSVYAFPKYRFFKMIAKCDKNSAQQKQDANAMTKSLKNKSLPTFRLEGTAPTLPVTFYPSIVHTLKKIDTSRYKTTKYVNVPSRSDPLSISKTHAFYKLDAHVYTDELLEKFQAGALTFVSVKDNKRWGKNFFDVMSNDADVCLWLQPISNFDVVYKICREIVSYLHPSTYVDGCHNFEKMKKNFRTNSGARSNTYICPVNAWSGLHAEMTPEEKEMVRYSIEAANTIESVKIVFFFETKKPDTY